jgi:hypothetical protein
MHAVGTQLGGEVGVIQQNGDAFILCQGQQSLREGSYALGIATRDMQAGDIGCGNRSLQKIGKSRDANAARDELGRRREIESTGWGFG